MELIDRIFYGTIEELRVNGVKFTMDSLADRLGISKRTLYETIPSKKEVVELVIDRTFADVKKQQAAIFEDKTLPLVEKLRKLLTIIPTYADILDYRRVNEIRRVYPQLHQKISDYINTDWDRTIALLEEGMMAGVVKQKNLVILKVLLCEIFEKLLDGMFLIRNNITYEVAMQETISIVLDGILIEEKNEKRL